VEDLPNLLRAIITCQAVTTSGGNHGRKDRCQHLDTVLTLRRSRRSERRASKAYSRNAASTASAISLLGQKKQMSIPPDPGTRCKGGSNRASQRVALPVAFERLGSHRQLLGNLAKCVKSCVGRGQRMSDMYLDNEANLDVE
jgi:hypothetical protein